MGASQWGREGRLERGCGVFQRLQPKDVAGSARVLYVWLEGGEGLCPRSEEAGNPTVRLRLCYDDDEEAAAAAAGDVTATRKKKQEQESSVKLVARAPRWCPAERFEFAVDQREGGRLVADVVFGSRRHRKESFAGAIDVWRLVADGETAHHQLPVDRRPFASEDSGTPAAPAFLSLWTRFMPKAEAFDVIYDLVWEYGRLDAEGPKDVDIDRDPGRFSDEAGETFATKFDDVSPRIPAGYEVSRSWGIESTKRNADGWLFSTKGFRPDAWLDDHHPAANVCRRRWTRECRRSLTESSPLKLGDILLHQPPNRANYNKKKNGPRDQQQLPPGNGGGGSIVLNLKDRGPAKKGCVCFAPRTS